MKRPSIVLVALLAGVASLLVPDSAANARTSVRWVYINSDKRSPLLVGMPLSDAVDFVKDQGIKLNVLRVFEDAPKGLVTQEPRGLPGPLVLVVSKGPPASLRAVLPGAHGPPVAEECAPRFVIDEDNNGSPATCGDGDSVNVAVWDYFASSRPPMYSLGRRATRCQVAAVYDFDRLNLPMDTSVYDMAKAYYGWKFGPQFIVQLANAGPYADNCKKPKPSGAMSNRPHGSGRLGAELPSPKNLRNVPRAPSLSFPQPVRSALAFLQTKTDRLLAGPTVLYTGEALSAQVSVDRKGGYQVNLSQCSIPYPINDPRISFCQASVQLFGFFGIEPEASPSRAIADLPKVAEPGTVPEFRGPCSRDAPVTTVEGQRVSTCAWAYGFPTKASWHDGSWTIVCILGPDDWQQYIEPLILRLRQTALPPFRGWIVEEAGGDGEHTTAVWADHSTLIVDNDYHSAAQVVDLITSTRILSR